MDAVRKNLKIGVSRLMVFWSPAPIAVQVKGGAVESCRQAGLDAENYFPPSLTLPQPS